MTDRIITGPGCNTAHGTDAERIEVRIWAFSQVYREDMALAIMLDQADTLASWVLTGRTPQPVMLPVAPVRHDAVNFYNPLS